MHDETRPDVRGLEAIAYEQGGYFDAAQARKCRVSAQLLAHYSHRGRFERIRRGIYRIANYPTDEFDEMRKQWISVGRDYSVLSHESALALYELSDNIPDAVHLLVPRRHRGLRKPSGVSIHTRPDNEQIVVRWLHGLPVTSPARTLADAHSLLQPDQWEMAYRQAMNRGLTTDEQLVLETHFQSAWLNHLAALKSEVQLNAPKTSMSAVIST